MIYVYIVSRKERIIMKALRTMLPVLLAFVLVFTSACGSNKKVTIEMAQAYLNEGKYEEAIEAYTALIEVDPNNIDLYMGRADAYVYVQRYEDAVTDYSSVVEIDNTYVDAYSYRGILYFELDDLENGELDLNNVANLVSGADRDAAFEAIRAYIDRLEFSEVENEDNEAYTANAFQLPGGGYLIIYKFSDGTYGVTSVPSGEPLPSLALDESLYGFRWYNEDGFWYNYQGPIFAEVTNGSVTLEYGGNTETLGSYYQNGGFYAGAYLLGGSGTEDTSELYMAFFVENGMPNLVIGSIHAADSQVFRPYFGH